MDADVDDGLSPLEAGQLPAGATACAAGRCDPTAEDVGLAMVCAAEEEGLDMTSWTCVDGGGNWL